MRGHYVRNPGATVGLDRSPVNWRSDALAQVMMDDGAPTIGESVVPSAVSQTVRVHNVYHKFIKNEALVEPDGCARVAHALTVHGLACPPMTRWTRDSVPESRSRPRKQATGRIRTDNLRFTKPLDGSLNDS